MRLALFQPDIPQNTGTLIRLAACMDVQIDIIEPCGFPLSEKTLRRAGMDYIDLARLERHASWDHFLATLDGARIVLLTTKSSDNFNDFAFSPQDVLLLGRESAGVPEDVHARADARLTIPMIPEARSLNIAISAAMVLGEALRQTNTYPTA
jgi:tRNA (cytidine/uridine-2'-O-)-methyltransferase